MSDEKEISSVTISKTKRGSGGTILEEKFVRVANTDVQKCEKIARDIFKKELRQK
jgi:hypothetical protein